MGGPNCLPTIYKTCDFAWIGGNKNSSTKNIYYGLVTCPSLGTLLPGTSSYKHTCLLVSGYLPKKERKKNDEIIWLSFIKNAWLVYSLTDSWLHPWSRYPNAVIYALGVLNAEIVGTFHSLCLNTSDHCNFLFGASSLIKLHCVYELDGITEDWINL